MKPFDPDSSEFDPRQLDLPLSLRLADRDRAWDGDADYPSSQQVLAHFLDEIGVTQPMRMAGHLVRDFGSVGAVMSASWWRLRGSVGIKVANAISASRDLMKRALTEVVAAGPVISNRREVMMLLQAHVGSLRRERLIALYLDSKLRLLRIERISEGTRDSTSFDISRIIHSGLDVGACGLLLVHNHPSGDAESSQSDKSAISRLSRVAADLDMHLIDALIVAGGECRSMLNGWTKTTQSL
jgi:DNA repair protein RadC